MFLKSLHFIFHAFAGHFAIDPFLESRISTAKKNFMSFVRNTIFLIAFNIEHTVMLTQYGLQVFNLKKTV